MTWDHPHLPLNLGCQIAEGQHRETPSPQSAIVCRPGYASCAPKAFGAELAMDAHENEPKSLRFIPPLMCLANPDARRAAAATRTACDPKSLRGRPAHCGHVDDDLASGFAAC
jgi:hypothetical protein